MGTVPVNVQPFPGQGADVWIEAYKEEVLVAKDAATIEAYIRILEKFAAWLTIRPGNSGQFHPQAMTRTAIECFLDTLPSFSFKSRHAPPSPASVAGCRKTSSSWNAIQSVAFRSPRKHCLLLASSPKTSAT